MKIKEGLTVNFNTPVGEKRGEIIKIDGTNVMIKANTFPFSKWTVKVSDIIEDKK